MKINTVQTILFRLLRDVNEQHRREKSGHSISGAAENKTIVPGKWRRAKLRIRRACVILNDWLALYYRLCGRTGFDLPVQESQVICLHANEVVQLTRAHRAKHLQVKQGIVWLTGTPANGDKLLRDGERFVLERHWPFVVQAIGRAKIILLP